MVGAKTKRLGEHLVDAGVLTQQQVDAALEEQNRSSGRLGEVILRMGMVDEETFVTTLARQLNVPLVDLKDSVLQPETVHLIPEPYARVYNALAIERAGDHVVVGMDDPSDINALDALSKAVPLPIQPVLVRPSDLRRLQDLFYRYESEIANIATSVDAYTQLRDDERGGRQRGPLTLADAPAGQMVDLLFSNAVRMNASDIHIEPDEEILRIRTRVDGVLHEQILQQKSVATVLASRLKTMAGLDISEKRLPQDGHFDIEVSGRRIDVRLSTMPVQHGESVVMRLLDQSAGVFALDRLGMPMEMMERFRYETSRPHGMILVTGPTGSGKTTTLYAALRERNNPEEKILTVEDPVEYKLPRINQVQVNPRIGLDFGRVLRSALRQDPDVILIGEIRDRESMEIGLRAAMTGHLVLSTLHTNDAISAVSRLTDLGGEGYLIASTLRTVVSQRLVRRLCNRCKQEAPLQPHQQRWADLVLGEGAEPRRFMAGVGCSQCEQTGYRGRIGVFEMILVDEQLKADLNRGDMQAFESHARAQKGYRGLISRAMEYALSGVTSVEEVMRVTDDLDLPRQQKGEREHKG